MNGKHRIAWKRICAGSLAAVMAAAVALGAIPGKTASAAPAVTWHTYSETYTDGETFDEKHSAGYFCITNTQPGPGAIEETTTNLNGKEVPCYLGRNTEKDTSSIYLDHYNGAVMDGEYYDVREYVWQDGGGDGWRILKNDGGAQGYVEEGSSAPNTAIHREFHFYKSGTLKTGGAEVDFSGVMRLADLDTGEAVEFPSGFAGDAWRTATSTVVYDMETCKFYGTEDTVPGDDDSEEIHNSQDFWVQVDSDRSNENYLTMVYYPGGNRYMWVNYEGCQIYYKIVSDGVDKLPPGAESVAPPDTLCARAGTYHLAQAPAEEFTNYEFDGWYVDPDRDPDLAVSTELEETITDGMERIYERTDKVFGNKVYYGTYYKVAYSVTTEVVNGTITESSPSVPKGSDKTVIYHPDTGYVLESVTVDGVKVDPESYAMDYTFTDVEADHTIRVVYADSSIDKAVYLGDERVDGLVANDKSTLTYRIYYENPTDIERTVTVTDIVPENVDVLNGHISDLGDYNKRSGEIAWTLTAAAHAGGYVSFDCYVEEEAQGSILKNSAKVIIEGIPGTERDIVMTDAVVTPILADPYKSVVNAAGKDITDKVVNNGSVITYQITFANPANANKVFHVTDVLPDGVSYVEGSISDGGTVSEDEDGNQVASWDLALAAGERKTVTVDVKVRDPSAALTKVYNRATVSVDKAEKETVSVHDPDDGPASNYVFDDPVKAVLNDRGDNIGGDADGNKVQTVKQADDTLTYQISFANPADSAREFLVTDVLPEGVEYVSSDHEGAYAAESRTVTWKVTLSANEAVSVRAEVKILSEAEGKILMNRATVAVDEAEKTTNRVETPVLATPGKAAYDDHDRCIADGGAGDEQDQTILKSGDTVTYEVTFANPSDGAKTFSVADALPDGVRYLYSDHGGEYDGANHTVLWKNISLSAHEESGVHVTVQILAEAEGSILKNHARVTVDEAAVNSTSAETPVLAAPEKAVFDEDGNNIGTDEDGKAIQTVKQAGDTLTYEITYTNPSEREKKFSVKDTLPEGVEYVSSDPDGEYDSGDRTVVWKNLRLPAKETGSVRVTVRIREEAEGTILKNRARVAADNATMASGPVKTAVMEPPVKDTVALDGKAIDTMPLAPGEEYGYTITVRNPADTDKTATICDVIPDETDYVASDLEGAYDGEKRTVTWTVEIPAHGSAAVSVWVKAKDGIGAVEIKNRAKATIDDATQWTNQVKNPVRLSLLKKSGDAATGGGSDSGGSTKAGAGIDTGDHAGLSLWIFAGLIALTVAAAAVGKRKKKPHKGKGENETT